MIKQLWSILFGMIGTQFMTKNIITWCNLTWISWEIGVSCNGSLCRAGNCGGIHGIRVEQPWLLWIVAVAVAFQTKSLWSPRPLSQWETTTAEAHRSIWGLEKAIFVIHMLPSLGTVEKRVLYLLLGEKGPLLPRRKSLTFFAAPNQRSHKILSQLERSSMEHLPKYWNSSFSI